MPGSSAGAGAVMEGHPSLRRRAWQWHAVFAWPGSHRGATSPPFVFPLSGLPTCAAEPGTAVQQISQQHGAGGVTPSPNPAQTLPLGVRRTGDVARA